MKKKMFAALLAAGALIVTPVGGGFLSMVATASSNDTVAAEEAYEPQSEIVEQILNVESGGEIRLEGETTLSNSVMQELLARGDVSLVMEYTYEGVDYVIVIPAGAALDTDIPWYGPLYLAAHFGNSAGRPAAATATYTVQSGDTLSRIARANGMTLAELTAKNPQITNVNNIRAGQTINLK